MTTNKFFAQITLAAVLLAAAGGAAIADEEHHSEGAEQPAQVQEMMPAQMDGMMHEMMPAVVKVGTLSLSGAFIRATPADAKSAGSFLDITNTGADADRLVAALSPAAAQMGLHEMKLDGKIMKMSEKAGGIEIPAGETLSLATGGFLHMMFVGIKAPFVVGETVPVTLTFEKAGTVDLILPVESEHFGHDH